MKTVLHAFQSALSSSPRLNMQGRVIEVVGTIVRAIVPGVQLGECCQLCDINSNVIQLAEVIGFRESVVLLALLGDGVGLSPETVVIPTGTTLKVPFGETILGRVLDGFGRPLDILTRGELYPTSYISLIQLPPNPLMRRPVKAPLSVGIRAIDVALTCGEGQRMGIFASAGVGKSTLLAQMMRHTEADVIVLALVGERGREVRTFLEECLGEAALSRSVIVVATSDRPAMERIKAAYTATSIAEAFRQQGRRVLLLMDSITRFARAQREIGLSAGEPPVRRGFPPSVFAELPRLMERSGNDAVGSITAFYTVLVEGEIAEDPIAEEVKSILDGHIVLSATLACEGHYPAIDILRSVSRCQNELLSDRQSATVKRLRELLSAHESVDFLLKVGEYHAGSNPLVDESLVRMPTIREALKQSLDEKSSPDQAWAQVEAAIQ